MRLVAIAALLATTFACSDDPGAIPPPAPPELTVIVQSVRVDRILPGSTLFLEGAGFSDGGTYTVHIDGQVGGQPVRLDLAGRYGSAAVVEVEFPPDVVRGLPEGMLSGLLRLEVQADSLQGSAEIAVDAPVVHTLAPSVSATASGVYPQSIVPVFGAGFITGGEGRTVVELRGTFTSEVDGSRKAVDVFDAVGEPPRELVEAGTWQRDEISFVLDPAWTGIDPGALEGELRVVNQGAGWTAEGSWLPIRMDLLPPLIEQLDTLSASRGEAVRIRGQGFVGGDSGGTTVLRLDGQFRRQDGEATPLDGLELTPLWATGSELVFSFRVDYEFGCTSGDLGANPGTLEGTVTPVITWQGNTVEGSPRPLTFEIEPTRQVVWLRFLPAFTDSLRLFGLRNVGQDVRDRILAVMERDYGGINLEIRLTEPRDFLEYSIVEIGGPDPNGGNLFGLDNTPDLDHCNQRLDDFLAGRNADSEGYGGIFVESFLQLSPRRSTTDNPLAHPAFDEIFDPVIESEVQPGEYPGGPRDAVIERAIRTLGNLVGNTATHEIGHSLGLPRLPGCGQYHNAAGERQIMDCGRDRPFEERAELVEGTQAVWTPENRQYLEEILPIR